MRKLKARAGPAVCANEASEQTCHTPQQSDLGYMPLSPYSPLSLTMVPSAKITAMTFNENTRAFSASVYDNNGTLIKSSQRISGVGGDRVKNADPPTLPIGYRSEAFVPGECLYLGFMMNHYGHWLLETLATFWSIPIVRPRKVIFSPFIFGRTIPRYAETVLSACGIGRDMICITEFATTVENLLVPDRTFGLNQFWHEQHAITTRKIRDALIGYSLRRERSSARKLFLSRSELQAPRRGHVQNQVEIENIFENRGFHIIHPEKILIEDQAYLFDGAEVIAGFSGSALHNVLFTRPQTTVIELCDIRSGAHPLPAQVLCNEASDARGNHVPFVPKKHAANESDPEAIIAALDGFIK